ncbi:MAG: ribokinase [Thermotogae bacterium]|nr:MAG: ribokinase [Thermotogota bacterium]
MILVVGSANADIVLKVDHFTEVGETQVVQSLEVHGGGKGANQALTAAKLGGRCAFISCVGRDEYGKMLKASLEGHGITGVGAVQNAPTGRAYIEVDKTGRNRILVVPGANHSLTVEVFERKLESLPVPKVVLLQNEIPFSTTLHAAKKLKGLGALVIFDPAPVRGNLTEILPYVDYLTPNEVEAQALLNQLGATGDLTSAAKTFLQRGVKRVVLKLGEKGALILNKDGTSKIRPFKVNAVDTTAAGDVFNGAFAVAIWEGKTEEEAALFASAAAAISVTRMGAQSSIPERSEVETFLKNSAPPSL